MTHAQVNTSMILVTNGFNLTEVQAIHAALAGTVSSGWRRELRHWS